MSINDAADDVFGLVTKPTPMPQNATMSLIYWIGLPYRGAVFSGQFLPPMAILPQLSYFA